ncbi:MAG: enoyl-CoA hydratase/isomerase family protein [Proteobacteria bacterium]|nr:enoyl-CoA hydratase/isomerase family protein [Pseudomonadota bacterium]HQR02778.1 enoyl-CoA hydratase-related protein [Rhodocyclaceae bacterium]
MSDDILIHRQEAGTAWVILNRPDKLNAFTPEMGDALLATFLAHRDNPAVRSVVLTGAGRGFCAGADREVQNDPERLRRLGDAPFLREFAPLIHHYPKPTIAAINGPAAGIGVTAILGFDLLLAARSARFVLPFASLNIPPGLGATYHLPRRVGVRKATEWLMLGEPIDADAALDAGLVNRVLAENELQPAVRTLCERLNRIDPAVLVEMREALRHGAHSGFDAALAREARVATLALAGAYPPRDLPA